MVIDDFDPDSQGFAHGDYVAYVAQAVAPGAKIWTFDIGLRDLYTNQPIPDINGDDVAEDYALSWVSEQWQEWGIIVVNMSYSNQFLREPIYCDDQRDQYFQQGPIYVAAAGNDGDPYAAGPPACSYYVIPVGAVWDFTSNEQVRFGNCVDQPTLGNLTCYSNASSHAQFVAAPGSRITSRGFHSMVKDLDGTSFAAPHVAGGWAVIAQILLETTPSEQWAEKLAEAFERMPYAYDRRTDRYYRLFSLEPFLTPSGPPLEVYWIAPKIVQAGSTFEAQLVIRVVRPTRAIMASVYIPDSFGIVSGQSRYGWLSPELGATFKVGPILSASMPGTFTLRATVTPVTSSGALWPLVAEAVVTVLPREETPPVPPPPPPPPPPPSGGVEISLEATATRVVPGQEIIVRARITNNGTSTVTMPVPFTVDGKPIITSNVTVAPGRTEIVEFKIAFSLDQTGAHIVTVGNSPPLTIYVEGQGPGPSKTPEQFFDSNANGRLDDLEILTALDYWIKQRPVPDIGVLSELQILALLDKWIKGTPIAGH
ncbi:MAG: S8/S53 family peptidase [Candidatus Caldarchaeum sp.]